MQIVLELSWCITTDDFLVLKFNILLKLILFWDGESSRRAMESAGVVVLEPHLSLLENP